jgi:hypothetical protein
MLSVRERWKHRKNPACTSCHKVMDPLDWRCNLIRRRVAGDNQVPVDP